MVFAEKLVLEARRSATAAGTLVAWHQLTNWKRGLIEVNEIGLMEVPFSLMVRNSVDGLESVMVWEVEPRWKRLEDFALLID